VVQTVNKIKRLDFEMPSTGEAELIMALAANTGLSYLITDDQFAEAIGDVGVDTTAKSRKRLIRKLQALGFVHVKVEGETWHCSLTPAGRTLSRAIEVMTTSFGPKRK
jgi:hypothetical protein